MREGWRVKFPVILLLGLALASPALGRELSFEEYAVVQESLALVHPRIRAMAG